MTAAPRSPQRRRNLVRALSALAALPGLWFGYGFGDQLGGPWIGVVTALNGGLICSLLAGSLADRLLPRPHGDRETR